MPPSSVGSTSKLGILLVERLVVVPSAVAPPPVVVARGLAVPLPDAKNEPEGSPVPVPPLPPPTPVPVAVKSTVMSALLESQP